MPRFLFFILFFYSINAFSYTNNRIYSYYLSESEAFSACQANELGDGNLCINGFAVNFVAPQCTNTSGRVGNLFRPIINNVRDEYRYVFCTPDQSCPNVDEVLDPQTGQCYLPQPQISQCSDYGFDPTSFIPLNSVCQNDGSSYPDMQCLNGETTYDLPRCNLALCPDGSTINAANNETCPVPKQCFDGSIKYGDEVCPTPFICPDGRQVSSQELCDSPVEESHECSNGDIIPVSQLCPISESVTCLDGSTAPTALDCPNPNSQSIICDDGTKVQNVSQCPSPIVNQPNQNDTSTSTSTSTATTTNNTNNTVETTTTTTTTQVELDLSGVNGRLDKINKSIEKITDKRTLAPTNPTDLYTPDSSATYTAAFSAFNDRVLASNIATPTINFLDVDIGSPPCPVYTSGAIGSGNMFSLPSVTIDQQCSQVMTSIWPYISAVLLAVATFFAFRIAFLQ